MNLNALPRTGLRIDIQTAVLGDYNAHIRQRSSRLMKVPASHVAIIDSSYLPWGHTSALTSELRIAVHTEHLNGHWRALWWLQFREGAEGNLMPIEVHSGRS